MCEVRHEVLEHILKVFHIMSMLRLKEANIEQIWREISLKMLRTKSCCRQIGLQEGNFENCHEIRQGNWQLRSSMHITNQVGLTEL